MDDLVELSRHGQRANDAPPLLSILVCTHNRAEDVAACIGALTPQLVDGVEIVLVDSASSPEIARTLESIAQAHPFIRASRLDTPGVSLARNEAAARARGEWLAILDDDAVPDPDWVREVLALLQRLPPRTGVVGLYTRPIWPADEAVKLPPLWFKYLSLIDIEAEEERSDNPIAVGANMLVRREVWLEAGGSPRGLSRMGRLLFSGDDSYMLERARRAGWRIWYSNRPRAGHRVTRARLKPAWFRERMFWEGVTEIKLRRALGDPTPVWWFVRALAFAPALALLALFDGKGGTRLARALWHCGVVCALFIDPAPETAPSR